MQQILLSISGPTGIGKTSWGIRLAKYYKAEILSADSRQFYREMRIGVARPDPEELAAVPHHFVAHRSIHESYSVGDFREEAIARLKTLYQKHDILLLVGGSGLYMDAVTRGLDAFPPVRPEIREALQATLKTEGLPALQERLRQADPSYYEEVDLQNPRRVLRALEVFESSGRPFSYFRGNRQPPDFFRELPLAITAPREVVYKRIERRVDAMMAAGLLEEARALYPYRNLSALQTVGYQELFAYFEDRCDLATAVSEIKKNTRRFAKRQMTWWRKRTGIHQIDYNAEPQDVLDRVDHLVRELQKEKNG